MALSPPHVACPQKNGWEAAAAETTKWRWGHVKWVAAVGNNIEAILAWKEEMFFSESDRRNLLRERPIAAKPH